VLELAGDVLEGLGGGDGHGGRDGDGLEHSGFWGILRRKRERESVKRSASL
jgi:hypothetical protein